MDIVLSQEQEQFIQKSLEGNNILVDACIGSGKTTSIQHLCQCFPSSKNILYLTYNRLLKTDAKSKIHGKNITVTNYHGFAYKFLKQAGISCGVTDLIQEFNKSNPPIPFFDILIIDEYQDIDFEFSTMLEIIKRHNPSMQIIAVGDMKQKIYDKTSLDVLNFINDFLGEHICLNYTQCFRLNKEHAAMLGRIWNKDIVGTNNNCKIIEMSSLEAAEFLSSQPTEDILCLGARQGCMSSVLNKLEYEHPERFNKKTVYASISDQDSSGGAEIKKNTAIFTTYDSSKGLERKICVLFDFTESYWTIRANQPQQSYEILRNVFCVAASRGKEQIIFVNNNDKILSEKTLSTPIKDQHELQHIGFSEMFDFKYKESIEKCYSLLNIKRISNTDENIIAVKTYDELIDLSPCIGIYQEASFFNNYDIDKELAFHCKLHKQPHYLYDLYNDEMKKSPIDRKILCLTAFATKQLRYLTQVSIPYITTEETNLLHQRLKTVFSKDENSQVDCSKDFNQIPNHCFVAKGFADVVKDNIVYELKFVSELKHEHFLQCACYMTSLNLKKGILWNTKNNEMYEIIIPNEEEFLFEVAKTVLKINPNESTTKLDVSVSENNNTKLKKLNINTFNNKYFAVIDTETTWSNKVMSIGISIVDKINYEIIDKKYYILTPEVSENGMYSNRLMVKDCPIPNKCSRHEALQKIKDFLCEYSVLEVFAYNASFDLNHLPEIDYVSWYDIMKIAAYKQFNTKIPNNIECYKTGKIKCNYGVEPITRLLSGNQHYCEKHNSMIDSMDETNIMKMLGLPYSVYIQNALIKSATCKLDISNYIVKNKAAIKTTKTDVITENNTKIKSNKKPSSSTKTNIEVQNQHDESFMFVNEVAELLCVSKSTVYNLIHKKYIFAQKIGNKYHISKNSVFAYIEKMKQRRRNAIILCIALVAVTLFYIFLMCSNLLND